MINESKSRYSGSFSAVGLTTRAYILVHVILDKSKRFQPVIDRTFISSKPAHQVAKIEGECYLGVGESWGEDWNSAKSKAEKMLKEEYSWCP